MLEVKLHVVVYVVPKVSQLIYFFCFFLNLLYVDGIAKEELMIGQEETGGTGSYYSLFILIFYLFL